VNIATNSRKLSDSARGLATAASMRRSAAHPTAARLRWIFAALAIAALTLLAGSAQAQNGYLTTVVGASGSFTAGLLNKPQGVAVDPLTGNLYIADTANCVVWVVPFDGSPTAAFAGQKGVCSSNSASGPYASTDPSRIVLIHPVDVAYCNGTLFIADEGSAYSVGIHQVTAGQFSNVPIQFTQANDLAMPTDYSTSPPTVYHTYVQPQAIACDSAGNLFVQSFYVAVDRPQNWTVDVYSATGSSANIFQQLDLMVQGVAVNPNGPGTVYTVSGQVNQPLSETILQISTATDPVTRAVHPVSAQALPLSRGLTTPASVIADPNQDPSSTKVELSINPMRITVDASGNFYVNEATQAGAAACAPAVSEPMRTVVATCIAKISTAAGYSVTYVAGTGTAGFNSDGPAPGTTLELNAPTGLALDVQGNLFLADTLNNRVRSFRNVQAGPLSIFVEQIADLQNFLGYQQYAINPGNGDFFHASGAGVRVFGTRTNALNLTLENVIATGVQGPTAASPITLIVDSVHNYVYANNSADGNLYVIDGKSLQVIDTIALNNPGAGLLAIDTALNQVYVAGSNSTAVSVVRGPTRANPAVNPPIPFAPPVFLANIGYPAVFISSLGVDPNSHHVIGICNSCAGGSSEGFVIIDGNALTATSQFLDVFETIAAPAFIGSSLALDPMSGSPILAGATSPIPNCTGCSYDAFWFTPDLRSNTPFPLNFPPISLSLDAANRVFYVTDFDGVPSAPSTNAAVLALNGNITSAGLDYAPIPLDFPNGALPAHVFDVQPDPITFQAYVSAVSQPAGSPAAPQGIVEIWDGVDQQVLTAQTVQIPNAGGGYLAVGSGVVYLMDNVNSILYQFNGTPRLDTDRFQSPRFSPPPGPVSPGTTVTITGPVPGVGLAYTTDGSGPGLSTTSITCTSPCQITLNSATTIVNAIQLQGGMGSDDASATYTVQQPTSISVMLSSGTVAGGNPVSVTAVLTPSAGSATGSVTFTAVPQGSTSPVTTLCAGINVASDQASCIFNIGTAGSYTISAMYSGDAFNAPASGSAQLTVTSSGSSPTVAAIPYGGGLAGISPVALTSNNTGSAATYVFNSDSSVGILRNGALTTGGCPAFLSGATVTGGAVYFDPTSSRLYFAYTSSSSSGGVGLGVSLAFETLNTDGTCTPTAPVEVTSFGSGILELAVDPAPGNVYLLFASQGGSRDTLFVYSASSLSQLSQNYLDYSATYGPLVLDASSHLLFINDLGSFLQAPAGLNASPGFFVFDPSQTGQQLEHVAGFVPPGSTTNAGQVLFSASALLADGKGNLIIVNQNPIPTTGTAKNPLPNLSTPLTILNTNQFSFFANTVPPKGSFCCSPAVDIEPSPAMSTISAVTSYTAMSAADVDAANGIVYGYAYKARAQSAFQFAPTPGSGALISYTLSGGAETLLGSGLTLATLSSSTGPWTQLTFDAPSNDLVLYAGTALGISGPVCSGGSVLVEQVLGGPGTTSMSTPAVNFFSGFTYDIQTLSLTTPPYAQTALYFVAPPSNSCSSAVPIVIQPASGTLPGGMLATSYNPPGVFTASGGVGTITWSVSAGNLPNGVNLNPMTGALSGTPLQAGTFSFTVKATDSKGMTASQVYALTIACSNAAVLQTPDLIATVGLPFSYQFMAIGGTGTLTYSAGPALLDGLTLSSTGLLSGTPLAAEVLEISVTATDATGCSTTATGSVIVTPLPPAAGIKILESIQTTDSVGNKGTLISAYVIPTIYENINTVEAPSPAAQLTNAEVSVTSTGLTYRRAVGGGFIVSCKVNIKNLTAATLTGPFQLVFNNLMPSGANVSGASGTFSGAPFLTLSSTTLSPGQTVTVPIVLTAPTTGLTFSPSLYVGTLP
jgi:hypothetical protein